MEAWRAAVLDAGVTWLRTPWMHNQCVQGAGGGVDCGRFLIASFVGAKLVEEFSVGEYVADWMLHQSGERYLEFVEQYMDPIDETQVQPADVVLWRFGKCFSHGAIVVDWPLIIHSYRPERGVVYGDATKGVLAREHLAEGGTRDRIRCFFTLKEQYR